MTKTKGAHAAEKPVAKKSAGGSPKSQKPARSKPVSDPRVAGAFQGDGSFSAHATSASTSGGKFWSVFLPAGGSTMTVTFGKIETDGQSRDTSFATHEKAAAGAASKLIEKLNKGYHLSEDENNNVYE